MTQDAQEINAANPKKLSGGKKALIIILSVFIFVIAGCCVALAADDSTRTQKVPEKTTLDGQIDISGMTQDELRQTISSRVSNGLCSVISLGAGGNGYEVKVSDVGYVDIEGTIADAFSPYDVTIFERFASRALQIVTGDTGNFNVNTLCVVDHDALVKRVTEIAKEVDRDVQNAGYQYSSSVGGLVAKPAQDGITLDVDATVRLIEAAASSQTDISPNRLAVQAVVDTEKPTSLEPGQAIFVDTSGCRVHLYENGAEVASYACTPGQSGYATPKGDFYLEYKDAAPTWINPHSSWSEGMAETIGPGASNPLGLRALAVSCGGGIYIHGTTNTGQLGSPGSHGCVRLSNSSIIELFDRVSEGIPIIIR
jgi:lipoprotein-anchoring transpeptidase ErfK/SrfK